jgi:glycosyltransferase involved in cell wall biosynthesis
VKVLFLIPSLDYGGAAKQLSLLAGGLPRERFTPRVCALGRPAPWGEALRQIGIDVEMLAWKRTFDAKPWLRLRELLRTFRPDVIHAWGLANLWPAPFLSRWSGDARLVLSAFRPARRLGRLGRWLPRPGACRIVAGGAAKAERLRRLGVPEEKVVVIPPGVALPDPPMMPGESLRGMLGLPADARLLAGVGPLEPHKGFYDAVWALDILKYVRGDLHFVLIGRGTDRPRLERFARSIDVTRQVHFLGERPDVTAVLRQADVVWVPSRREGGHNAALEAMAAGRPVVAARQLGLAEIVRDGETGLLYPPGDKAAMARLTRALLDDADRQRRMGEAGRRRAEEHFTVGAMVRRYAALYEHG